MITIRNEREDDFRVVEEITRKAFWNIHTPGCNEHYLVHVMREHHDFVPELDYVLLENNVIIGNIMYTRAILRDQSDNKKTVLTFGPVSILPQHQRKGHGTKLIRHSFIRAKELGYDAVVIFGNPRNYVGLGFKSCKKFDVCIGEDIFPSAMLVKELKEGALDKKKWKYEESDVFDIDNEKANQFDSAFSPMKKEIKEIQEEFYILSNSRIV